MSRIGATLYRRNGIYYLKWKEGQKWKYLSLGTTSLPEARRLQAGQQQINRARLHGADIAVRITLRDAIFEYSRIKVLSDSTKRSLVRAVDLFEEKHGVLFIDEMRRYHALEWRTWLEVEKQYKHGYIQRLMCSLQSTLNGLVQAEKIPVNPISGLKSPKRRAKEPTRYLEWADCLKLLEAAEKPFPYTAFVLGLYGGMRLAEILAAKWEHIQGDRMWVEGTKTESSAAYIPYHPTLRDALKPYRKRTGHICVSANGSVLAPSSMWFVFHDVAQRAKVTIPKDIAWHSLRHSFAVHLFRDCGYTLEQVAVLLRHSDYKQVTALYADIRSLKGQIDRF